MTDWPKFILVRADGEPMDGEYAFYACTTADEWDAAEAWWDDGSYNADPVEFVMLAVNPEPVARRTFTPEPVEDDEDTHAIEEGQVEKNDQP